MEGGVVLGYWAIRGLSERVRQLLEYLSIPYTEQKYEGAEGRVKWVQEVKQSLTAIQEFRQHCVDNARNVVAKIRVNGMTDLRYNLSYLLRLVYGCVSS